MRSWREPILGFIVVLAFAGGLYAVNQWLRPNKDGYNPSHERIAQQHVKRVNSDLPQALPEKIKSTARRSDIPAEPSQEAQPLKQKPLNIENNNGLEVHEEFFKDVMNDLPEEARLGKKDGRALAGQDGYCSNQEWGGVSPTEFSPSDARWNKVEKLMRQSRNRLNRWLDQQVAVHAQSQVEIMKARLAQVRLQRDYAWVWPDLSWRGIAVYTLDDQAIPTIRVGAGFLELTERDANRARFELTRVMAQVWSPCELQRLDISGAWSDLSRCMAIQENKSCEPGTYAESGWAVTTALAARVSAPGCKIPAFSDATGRACLAALKLSIKGRAISNDGHVESATSEGNQ